MLVANGLICVCVCLCMQSDGGKPISHYVVEKKDRKSGKWSPVSKFCRGPECDVGDLEEGESYEFRVFAVNGLGQSEPLVTDRPIVAKYQFGNVTTCDFCLSFYYRRYIIWQWSHYLNLSI